jgi:hypothetical protein
MRGIHTMQGSYLGYDTKEENSIKNSERKNADSKMTLNI